MELLIMTLLVSFLFSFIIFLLGVSKKNLAFSIIGSILLMLFSLTCVVIGSLGTGISKTTFNDTITTKTFIVDEGKTIEDTVTLIFGVIAFIFSAILLVYTVWSQKQRGEGVED